MHKRFFNRNSEIVAKDLLGKILVRKINGREMKVMIVETEAYFDEMDPASRARQNGDLRETMKMEAGTILVYGVHNNWLFNVVTDKENVPSAVLIRAAEPLNFNGNCKGPGLFTRTLEINKNLHKKNIFLDKEIEILDNNIDYEIVKRFRIGVSRDLPKKLRFYIKDNKWVSRR